MQLNDPILNLRPECEEDGDFLARLYRSSREDLLQLPLPEAALDSLIDMQFRAQQDACRTLFPGARYSIIEKTGESIGSLLVHHDAGAIRLVYLALLPHERNRGYGRCLIQALQSEAASVKKALTLSVFTQNRSAQRLYYSLGFQVVKADGVSLEMVWPDIEHVPKLSTNP